MIDSKLSDKSVVASSFGALNVTPNFLNIPSRVPLSGIKKNTPVSLKSLIFIVVLINTTYFDIDCNSLPKNSPNNPESLIANSGMSIIILVPVKSASADT